MRTVPVVCLTLILLTGPAVAGPVVTTNFTGTTLSSELTENRSGSIPPDTMGAVGPSHIVELINGQYAVYDKSTTTRVEASSLNAFWTNAGVSFTSNTFDPRILYDADAGRWFAAAVDNGRNANSFLIAVSDTNDPTDGWTGFAVDSDTDDLQWADFPTMGFNDDGVYISANMFPVTGAPQGTPTVVNILVLPKADLLAATPTVANATLFESNSLNDTGFAVQPAVDYDGNGLPEYLWADWNTGAGLFKLSNITGTIASPSLALTGGLLFDPSLAAPGPPDADQPGPKNNIETNDTRFSGNAVIVNGDLWAVQPISVSGNSAIRWFRVDPANGLILATGVISDASLDFYFPSIAVNANGDVVIGFSGSSGTQYVSAYAVVGRFNGTTTTFGNPILLQAGTGDYQILDGIGRNRWGDYSATVVDPTDSRRFWTFQQWSVGFDSQTGFDNWAIQISEIFLSPRPVPEPGTFVLLGVAGAALVGLRIRRRLRKSA